ncbi:MAG: hypothetical protein ABWX82_12400 [Leifsonia sp.]
MTTRLGIVADLPAFVVATAGLPLSAYQAVDASDAIVVVDGATAWWSAAARAAAAGAAAVLVSAPRDVPIDAVRDLVARCSTPIIVHRPDLRQDIVEAAEDHRDGVRPRIAVVECRAAPDALPTMVRDAVGWVRVLANSRLEVAAVAMGRAGGTALLSRRDGGAAGSVIIAVTRPEGAIFRLQALGETTTELEIDGAAGRSELTTSTSGGRRVAPQAFEAGERLAIRRAIEVVRHGRPSSDLDDLLHDATTAAAIIDQAGFPTL